ncbi:MAG TPA: site-specific integrase, partial [Streptosporangiaceae bacterium]|nr:site-specific integrase [Streptosporangiaceae bacterium]
MQLSGWLADAGWGAADLDAPAIERYLAARRAAGYGEFVTPRALAPLLGYLRRVGVAPLPEAPVPRTPAEELLDDYRRWLLAERGLRPAVARGYLNAVRPFVTAHAVGDLSGLRELAAADVTAFLLAQSRRLGPKTLQRVATALRSLLRFWHLQGLTGGPLDRAVPKAANRRAGLPRPLEQGQVATLLASCDRETGAGRRDLAMLILLARLGLRAGEVAALRLEDVDWRAGEISVAGKGGRRDLLP